MQNEIKTRPASETLTRKRPLKNYPAPWKGQILLACSKCQKKLRRQTSGEGLARLAKMLKRRTRQDQDRFRLKVIKTPCLKLCPKGGVTVCTQAQLGRGECTILRSSEDVELLYHDCKMRVVA